MRWWAPETWEDSIYLAFKKGEGCPECFGKPAPSVPKPEAHAAGGRKRVVHPYPTGAEFNPDPAVPVPREEGSATPLSGSLGLIGVLQIIGGIGLCVYLWPGEPQPGYPWLPAAYVPALTWLVAGLVSGILFFAVAAVLVYLADIRDYLRAIRGDSHGGKIRVPKVRRGRRRTQGRPSTGETRRRT
jgi:hypothetical protein